MPREQPAREQAVSIKDKPKSATLAAAKWKSSGLSDAHAKALKLEPLEPADTAALLSDLRYRTEAVKIPYFTLQGKPTDFFRVRFLGRLPGFAGTLEKPQRYAQVAGSINEVYFPPLLKVKWIDVAKNASVPIFVTEGEFKAACACAHGLACLGLGGVDVWRSTKRGLPLLPALKEIEWKDRPVVIIYDSDAATNPNVVRAQRKLAEELLDLGARPSIASLPPLPDGGKQGLDDLLVAKGLDALNEVINEAEEFNESAALWTLNEEVVYVKDPGIVIEVESGQKINPTQFMAHAYANRHYVSIEQTKAGPVAKKKKLAPKWIEWERRHELRGITYAPGQTRITPDGRWNAWQGWGCEPVKGDVGPWNHMLDLLFGKEVAARKWFEQWCAYPIQHPGAKMYAAAMLWGQAKGSGKTATAYALMRIYGKNAIEIKSKDLKGGFNAWQENRQFIYGDEIASADAGVKRIDSEWLKGLITQEQVKINAKYMPEIIIPDVMNFLFTSNNPDALFLEHGDRRYFIHEVMLTEEEVAKQKSFYDRYDKWLHGSGPSHLFAHLLDLDISDFDPKAHAPKTAAKTRMTLDSKSDLGTWAYGLMEDPASALAPLGPDVARYCALFTPAQLLHAYDPEKRGKVSANGLGRELKRIGLHTLNEGAPIRTSRGLVRLWAVREPSKWQKSTLAEIKAHFEKFFGDGTNKLD